ncbi:MAG: cytochrome C [Gemmatimonadetes bacterium]|nr:cytochrome C [Gemmatimonadota bacterium]
MSSEQTVDSAASAPASENGGAQTEIDAPKRKVRDIPRVHTWPHLLRMELLCTLVIMVVMVLWSVAIDAPLEEPANPTLTPNPSKAPWYFLGLQEMLVYFDPWMAGVVLPSLIIVGLMAIPYIDINPRGNGYYTWRERPFAMINFLVGFWILWILLIIEGVFLRGPGWNFFLPWQEWDAHKVVALTNVDLHEMLGVRNPIAISIVGAIPLAIYYGLAALYWKLKSQKSPVLKELGLPRYAVTAFLFLTMWLLPIKMLLRYTLNLKYIWVTPWFNI